MQLVLALSPSKHHLRPRLLRILQSSPQTVLVLTAYISTYEPQLGIRTKYRKETSLQHQAQCKLSFILRNQPIAKLCLYKPKVVLSYMESNSTIFYLSLYFTLLVTLSMMLVQFFTMQQVLDYSVCFGFIDQPVQHFDAISLCRILRKIS